MNTYILFGIKGQDLVGARDAVEAVFGIRMVPHESSYLGEYFRSGHPGSENFILQRNFDELEGEWMEPTHTEFGLLFYVNETNRVSEILGAVASIAEVLKVTEA